MALEQFFGRIVDVVRRTDGDELTAAAGISDTVLSVGDTADFDETGGTVEIAGQRYVYLELDHDANTLTLDTGLLAAAAVGDRVDVVDEELNAIVVEYVAHVELDEQDPGSEPIEVTVQHSLVDYLTEAVRGGFSESVTLLRTDPDQEPVIWEIDGKLVENVAMETRLDPIDATLVQLNLDLTELNDVTLPQVQADLAQAEADLGTLEGLFPITSTSISDGAITTPKMTANTINGDRILANSLTAAKIVALSITGDQIAANAISADKIIANAIGADEIAANAVTAGKIAATAIDGKTITGAHIRTDSSGSRIEIFDDGSGGVIECYDSAGLVAYINPYSIGADKGVQIGSTGAVLRVETNKVVITGGNLSLGAYSMSGANITASADLKGNEVYVTGVPSDGSISANCNMNPSTGRLRIASSSRRGKTNIVDADLDLDLVRALRTVAYTAKNPDPDTDPDQVHLGIIAEEAADAGLDQFVFGDADGQIVGFCYDRFGAVAVFELAKAADRRAAAAEEKVDELAATVATLTARLEALETTA